MPLPLCYYSCEMKAMRTESRKTTISLTSKQHESLKKLAAERGVSLSRLVREACLEMLEDEEDIKEGLKALADSEDTCTCEEYQKRRSKR